MATIIAMVCFAFIQPMPEDGRRITAEEHVFAEFSVPEDGNLCETPPLVDSILSDKTFTPYVTLSASPEIHIGVSREVRSAMARLDLPNPPPDPLIRPG